MRVTRDNRQRMKVCVGAEKERSESEKGKGGEVVVEGRRGSCRTGGRGGKDREREREREKGKEKET